MSAASAQAGGRRTRNLNRTEQIRIERPLDLRVSDFFRRAEQHIARVAYDDVDTLQFRKRAVDDVTHRRAVCDVTVRADPDYVSGEQHEQEGP